MMHDWVSMSIAVDWGLGQAVILVKGPSSTAQEIHADEILEIVINRLEPWGPSESINEVSGPAVAGDGSQTLEIEMQSGDVLTLRARSIRLWQTE